ncbi:translational activator of GCN4 [Malassezia obtusa]|uniref:Translational activator of GCN4 n=1 Tax=Malassezia obtusa TaxID=76774 RepID=A0AAF0E3R1_9BASI|nr:translational activator of GCN4 [Malassezia obtusa]
MRTRDIKQWLHAADVADAESPYNSDDEMAPGHGTRASAPAVPDAGTDWDAFVTHVAAVLRSTKRRPRDALLTQVLPKFADDDETTSSERVELYQLLLQAVEYHPDRATRLLLLDAGRALLSADLARAAAPFESELVRAAAQCVRAEAERLVGALGQVRAPRAQLAGVHAWVCTLLGAVLDKGVPEGVPEFSVLLQTFATVYDALAGTAPARDRLLRPVQHAAWRVVRTHDEAIPVLLRMLLATPAGTHALRAMTAVGVVADVCLHLRRPEGAAYLAESRASILAYFTTHVVAAKARVPEHVLDALVGFFGTVTQEECDAHVFPTLDKMLLRSPDVACPVASVLCAHARVDRRAVLQRVQQPLLSAVGSANGATREGALRLARVLVAGGVPDAFLDALARALKGSESRAEEQRRTLYALLGAIPAERAWSARVVDAAAPLVQKEAQPHLLREALGAVWHHAAAGLAQDTPLPAPALQIVTAKAQLVKPAVRAAALRSLQALPLEGAGGARFAADLVPLAEKGVAAGATALTTPECALEACAAARVLARLAHGADGASPAARAADAALRPLLHVDAKPSFLLADKVVRKLRDADAAWPAEHAAALAAVLAWRGYACLYDAGMQGALVAVLAAYGAPAFGDVRRLLESVAGFDRRLALRLSTQLVHALLAVGDAGADTPHADAMRLRTLLELAVRPVERQTSEIAAPVSAESTAQLLAELVVLAHVDALRDAERDFFVHLCRTARAEPHEVVCAEHVRLLEVITGAQADVRLAPAADAALATVAYIAPERVLAPVCERIVRDASPHRLEPFSEQDMTVWATPPGDEPVVDVLAAEARDTPQARGHLEKWDAEVRASLAAKKAGGAPTRTKQQQAAVDAQLAAEARVRADIEAARAHLLCALRTARAVAESRADVAAHMDRLVRAVRGVLFSARARVLGLGAPAAAALGALARTGEARAATIVALVLSTWLRRADDALVPLDWSLEPLADVELRVLYQLRLLVSGAPLSLGTASFVAPFLVELVDEARVSGDAVRDDAVIERMQLVLECLAAQSACGAAPAFPRAEVVRALLVLLRRFSTLAHDAVGALRAYGEAMARTTVGAGALAQQLQDAALSDERRERDGALQCLVPFDLTEWEFSAPLFLALHADDEELQRTAERIWAENAMEVPPTYVNALVALLEHPHAYVQTTTPRALGTACAAHPETFAALRDGLVLLYGAKNHSLEPEYDAHGLVIDATLHREDPWRVRLGVAHAFAALAPRFGAPDVLPFFHFALREPGALGDRHDAVRRAMLDAAVAVVDAQGAAVLAPLIADLESSLASESDAVTEAAVVLLGRAARHLAPGDAHVRRIVDRLLAALATPSELVQEAVGACLPPLVRTEAVARDVPALVDTLFTTLFHGEKYAMRRGAAYGLAGVVQGVGIGGIKALRVLPRLADAVADTSSPTLRQGAMFAYEVLVRTLRVLFEPYVPHILPHILLCFGDGSADVRDATADTARGLMQSVSGPCVKQILPELLEGLGEKQWRAKRGAVELLGAMAYCAPRQLSAALPIVIPRLSDVLTDSHTQLRQAANRALKQFGEVIHNPEIHALVPALLKALVDPNAKTGAALKALLGTQFVHYIDAPSLALIAPIIERALKERSVAQQKQAAQIVGNLASLTDTRDFVPYLDRYTPLVRAVLVSPVPDARSVAAKALGTLVERLGEVHFVDLIPALLAVLQSRATSVDRHGAAQGLAEVLAGLGMERMESLLPSIIAHTAARAAHVREGHLALLIYLPATFGARFVPHLPVIVAPIVGSIADEDENVREASMRAGRMLVGNYTQRAVDLLLPQLEPRLFDEVARMRLASLQLTGDLLFRLAGVSGKAEAADDAEDAGDAEGDAEGEGAEGVPEAALAAHHSIQRTLQTALGSERRTRLLAAIYILRQDPNIPVRQAAAHVWKVLVQNTPRTAREVLPVMLDLLVGALAAEGSEQHEMAGRTLGELVRKLGEKILHETIPLLATRAAHAPQPATRAGVCAAVADILGNATKTQLEAHEDALIAIVRGALVDASPAVRAAAARTFDAVQAHLGARAIDTTIPTLLAALRETTHVVRTRPEVVFPALVPALAQVPLDARAAEALATLVPVAGAALAPAIAPVLSCVARTLLDGAGDAATLHAAADAVFASLANIDALHQTMVLLLSWMASREGPARRALACTLLVRFCRAKAPTLDWSEYTVDCLRKLTSLLEEDAPEVGTEAHAALLACLDAVPKPLWDTLVVPLRRSLASTGAPDAALPGLGVARGPQPFVTLFLHGLLHGSAEQRENGALGLGDVVEKSAPEPLRPFVTQIVGPLIRLCGDRHAPPVKAAILGALDTLVVRVPTLVRPFYPQLQRSFQKALHDTGSGTVRARAGTALGALMQHQTRVDPVVLELAQGARAVAEGTADADAAETADALVGALAQVLTRLPAGRLGDAARDAVDTLFDAAFLAEDEVRESLKRALGDLSAAWLRYDAARATAVLTRHALQPTPVDVQLAALCVRACVAEAPDAFYAAVRPPATAAHLTATWLGDAPSVARTARETRDLLRRVEPWRSDDDVQNAL